VGNKIDESAELREVTREEGQAQAAEWGVQFMETSAKTNHNVTELFQVRKKNLLKCFGRGEVVKDWGGA
jgi:putative ribosome biogenesis GTPase RsgA